MRDNIGLIRLMGLIGSIRLIGLIGLKANRANIQERKSSVFNNTELINLVLIMFPAGRH